MAKAIWQGEVLAESERFEVVEGNVYFPPGTLNKVAGQSLECRQPDQPLDWWL